ncbi:One cut domain family member 2 [Trichinella pseudospiralis]|uniref:One cut domain family member n=1 Tax=Trichinella pseudospiralis TaxID=6337 RepID=A0A0V0YE91_TRIPS|nr:One cut domain family member 2 [Trichinella pseudospiralis]
MESLITDIHTGISGGPDACNGSASDAMMAELRQTRSPASAMGSLHDAGDFRSHAPAGYHTLNGRMSPSSVNVLGSVAPLGFGSVTYATLTPLQPLPPISTVTQIDKFSNNVGQGANGGGAGAGGGGGFTFVAQAPLSSFIGGCTPASNATQANSYNLNVKYDYDVKGNQYQMSPLTMQPSPPHVQQTSATAFNGYGAYHQRTQARSPKRADPVPKMQFDATAFDFDATGAGSLIGGGGAGGANGSGIGPGGHPADPSTSRPVKGKTATGSASAHHHHHHHHHNGAASNGSANDLEEINTKELAQRISAELKRYSIPQAIFAQRVLCRSQGTLSDLLRNPKPWSKLKSGRETFRRMLKWLQEPEFQRMSALRLAACKRKEEQQQQGIHTPGPKKPRLVFTDIQRRTLQAIFKETKRPSKEMQVTIAQQLGLDVSTVANFFMNARRRGADRWKDNDSNGSRA